MCGAYMRSLYALEFDQQNRFLNGKRVTKMYYLSPEQWLRSIYEYYPFT